MRSFHVTHPMEVKMCPHCGDDFLNEWIDGDHWFFKCQICDGEFYARPLQWEVRYAVAADAHKNQSIPSTAERDALKNQAIRENPFLLE